MAKHIQTRGRFNNRHDPTGKVFSQMNAPDIKFESTSTKLSLVATEFGHMFRLDVDLDQKTGKITAAASMTLEGQSKPIDLVAASVMDSGYLVVRCHNINDHNCWFSSRFKTKID
jgi:hypothetical protein